MIKRRLPLKLSLRKKLLFAAGTTLLFFVGLEIVLAAVGVRAQSTTMDRTAGFSSYAPLFVESTTADGQSVMSTAENKRHWFNYQAFPKHKAPGTMRIFCLGGSTTYGHPYWDSTSFAGWLRQTLPVVEPQHTWEVINAGGISYGSFRVAALMEELVQYQPDLFIVYSVHNEFLERRTYADMFDQPTVIRHMTALLARTRIWTVAEKAVKSMREQGQPTPAANANLLPAEVDEELNHTIGPVDYHRDTKWRAQVMADYQANLEHMIAIATKSGAKIVFVLPASNEKDCSPFKSELSAVDDATRTAIENYMSEGDRALSASQPAEAQAAYSRALDLDNANADAHYRLGQAWLGLNKREPALTEFRRAIDEDVCPLRAISKIEQTLREVCARHSVPLVDFQSRLRAWTLAQSDTLSSIAVQPAIFGDEQFLDHVHPTIEVNRQLGLWIIDELQRGKLLGGEPIEATAIQAQLAAIRDKTLVSIVRDDEIFALRNLAKVLHWSGKFPEAIRRARDVLELSANDPESRYIVACCLANMGRVDEALEEYDLLFADGIGYPRAYLPYGELLAASGQFAQAKAYLLLAILRSPNSATIYESLAEVHTALGETKFAEEALAKAKQLRTKN